MSNRPDDLETIPELELDGGVRGKYYDRYMGGTNIVLLEPDVARMLHDPVAVNQALRTYLSEHADVADAGNSMQAFEPATGSRKNAPWRLEATEPFVDSLKRLPDSGAVGSVVADLLQQVINQPQAAPLVAGTRVQIVLSPEAFVRGEGVPPLRLLYVLGHSSNRIRLLTIQLAENLLQVPENISAQLRPLLGDDQFVAPSRQTG
ncbi:MAG: hypothetical protein JWO56_212 [Acidobacteria bacterium]|nr:hypothetical protein [Acidobacteriota bacterium]